VLLSARQFNYAPRLLVDNDPHQVQICNYYYNVIIIIIADIFPFYYCYLYCYCYQYSLLWVPLLASNRQAPLPKSVDDDPEIVEVAMTRMAAGGAPHIVALMVSGRWRLSPRRPPEA
jgi:hypothetical protein